MPNRPRRIVTGARPDDHLTKAGNRIFVSLAVLAALIGTITTIGNGLRGETDASILATAAGGILFCLIVPIGVFVLPRWRNVFVFSSIAVVQSTLIGLAVATGLLLSSPVLFLVILTAAITSIAGVIVGGISSVATIAALIMIYIGNHTEQQITYVASSFIDWQLMLFCLSASIVFLYVGTAIFRYQMVTVARRLQEARSVAEKSEQAKSDFLANMSHEIRTPMNGVIGMLDVAIENEMADTQRYNLEVARRSAVSLIRVLTDILDLTKLEQGHIEIEPVPTDLHHMLEDAATLFSSAAAAKGVDLMTKGIAGLPRFVMLDGTRVGQILSNLLANAVKFTDDGSVSLEAKYDDGVLMIRIQDTGCGMPKDFLPAVFDRFKQAATDMSSNRGGTGLGLAICRDLTELMNGHIGVQSTVGEGTRFDVGLPAPLCQNPEAEAVSEEEPPTAPQTASLHILMAEDNSVNRSVLGAFLTRLGHTFVEAEDGHEACEFAREGNFDMIIMDVSMPRLDGIDATRMIRGYDIPIASAPIIMLTAHAEESYFQACLDAGADEILHKPITRERLAEAIHDVTKGDAPGEQPARVR